VKKGYGDAAYKEFRQDLRWTETDNKHAPYTGDAIVGSSRL
jgi:hypothetical protein